MVGLGLGTLLLWRRVTIPYLWLTGSATVGGTAALAFQEWCGVPVTWRVVIPIALGITFLAGIRDATGPGIRRRRGTGAHGSTGTRVGDEPVGG